MVYADKTPTLDECNAYFKQCADAYGIDHAEASSNEEAEQIIKRMVKSDKPFILVCNVYPDTPSI